MRVEGGPKGPSWVHQPLVEVEVQEAKGFVQFTLVKVGRAWPSVLRLLPPLEGPGLLGLVFAPPPPAGFWLLEGQGACAARAGQCERAGGRVIREGVDEVGQRPRREFSLINAIGIYPA